jgi:glycosyltransferase involved in cell wall biosynthesis
MRLLHVVPTYLPAVRYGGPIFAVHALCRALAARGHAVEVFTTSIDGPGNAPVPHDQPVMLDGVKIRYFASPALRRLSWAPTLARALRSRIDGADVAHLHSIFLWPTWAAARLARQAQVPYVISPRGMLVKKLIKSRHRLLKSAWISLIERTNLERAAAIHVTSAVEAAALAAFGFHLNQVMTVPNGADEVESEPASNPPDDIKALGLDQPLILFFGRMTWVKGLDRLLQAFARTRVGTLAIVGTDYDQIAPRLAQLAGELNIAHRVRLVPRTVTGADKEAVFAAASGFVLPSHSESFGNAAIEAMQRGLPVIVTEDVGAADIVREAGGGIVVEDDAVALGNAIERLMQNRTLAREMGERGQRYIREHCSWAGVAAQMETLYASLRA